MKTVFSCGCAMIALAVSASISAPVFAHDVQADDHAPIGVMADHTHAKGEVMFSLRHMHMEMSGNRIGTTEISPEDIVTTIPNRFAGMPGQPPTLRIAPTSMRVDMTMLGVMYAPSDDFTLMVMGSYLQKEMDHITFQGGMGTTRLGEFTTSPQGFGDVKVAALFPLLDKAEDALGDQSALTLKLGISVPTGSIFETAQVLTPMNNTPEIRVPYPMQSGSGTWDFEPSLTWHARRGAVGFGLQGAASIRIDRGETGYALGDRYEASAWASYRPQQWISFSARTRAATWGQVEGSDPAIMGPVQTANPDFHGGERLDVLAGVNLVATHGPLAGHRLGIEVGKPVWQDLNGPQLQSDWMLTVGWQKAF